MDRIIDYLKGSRNDETVNSIVPVFDHGEWILNTASSPTREILELSYTVPKDGYEAISSKYHSYAKAVSEFLKDNLKKLGNNTSTMMSIDAAISILECNLDVVFTQETVFQGLCRSSNLFLEKVSFN